MRLDRGRFHGAKILALGPFGPRPSENVSVAALWQNLLSLSLKLRRVDDAQLLHLGAAGVLDVLLAWTNAAAAFLTRPRGRVLSQRRNGRCCGRRRHHRSSQKKIAP